MLNSKRELSISSGAYCTNSLYSLFEIVTMDNCDLSDLTVDDLCDALHDKIHESALVTIREQTINGAMFVKLSDDDLKELFPQVGARLSVAMELRERRSRSTLRTSDLHAQTPNKDKVREVCLSTVLHINFYPIMIL